MTKYQFMKISLIMVLGLILMLTVGCGKRAKFESVYPGCSITGTNITCPDGTFYPLPVNGVDGTDGLNGHDGVAGRDGTDGVDGTNGTNGLIVAILDPCGDDPGHPDEVILVLSNGQYLAWYLNLGLVVLSNNTNYRTTDHQQCNFNINNGVLND